MLDQQWLIGSAEDCDLLIDAPTVSAHHCRFTRIGKQYFLEDCGSTNGTYCDGQRITAKTAVQPTNSITLGRSFPCPWPDSGGAKQIVFVGRDRENDFWLDRPNVSSLHARFMVGHAGTWVVEDLGSTNGVAIDLRGVRHRVRKAVAVQRDQTVYFGSTPATVEALIETANTQPPRPLPAGTPPTGTPPAGTPPTGTPPTGTPPAGSAAADSLPGARAAESGPLADRVAVAQLSAALPAYDDAPYSFHGPRMAGWFAVGALAAVGLFVLLSLYGEGLKHRLSDRQPTPPQGPRQPFDRPPSGQGPLAGTATAVVANPQSTKRSPDTVASPPLGTDAAAAQGLFWVLACDATGEPAFRLGMACSVDGKRLITTASIVEALRTLAEQGFPLQQVVHCQSQQRIAITGSGVHPLFAKWLARSRSLEQQYRDLRQIAQSAVDESSGDRPSPTREELDNAGVPPLHSQLPEQMKRLAHEEVALRDRMLCYDAGWLNVPPEPSLQPWQLGPLAPTLSRPLQPVRLSLAVIDAEDPYYDTTADPLTQTLAGRVHRLVRPPDTDTGRMEIRLPRGAGQPSLDGWNVAGAPVLDSSGRLLGLYVQPSVPQDDPVASQDAEKVNVDQRGDVVLSTVILEVLRAAESLQESFR